RSIPAPERRSARPLSAWRRCTRGPRPSVRRARSRAGRLQVAGPVRGSSGGQPSDHVAARLWLEAADADTDSMCRRLALVLVLAVVVAAGMASAAPATRSQFASAEIETVVDAGLMGPSVEGFRPSDPLTASELAVVVSSLGGAISISDPDALV